MVRQRRVEELMNPDVATVSAAASVGEARRVLALRGVSGAPVVDDDGRVVGVISRTDLARLDAAPRTAGETGHFFSSLEEYRDLAQVPVPPDSKPVAAVMSRQIHQVRPDTGSAVAANIMRERGIHRLLVLDQGRLVGILSSFDLLRIVEEVC